jgi:hypothetical protein
VLRSDVIDLVNSGRAWAFLGAGTSVDAGGVSWGKLVEKTLENLAEAGRGRIEADPAFKAAMNSRAFARAFGVIERHEGRETLERAVRVTLPTEPTHGSLVTRLADLPFEAYITLNYDGLLETSLARQNQLGWSAVGNTESELRQLSGGAQRIVWHLHGAASQPEAQSHLVLTEADYDAVYIGDSPLKQQLRAVLGTRRVVFFGFGFRDAEVLRVLKEVGRLADPTRPIIAFVAEDVASDEGGPDELLDRFNVDVITYAAADGDHGALKPLVHTYASFILRRSLHYRRPARAVPSYDPETTGLLIYNELVLSGSVRVEDGAFDALLRSRILSLLEARGRITSDEIDTDVAERSRLVHRGQGVLSVVGQRVEQELERLIDAGLAVRDGEAFALTSAGRNAVGAHAGTSERLARQFVESLRQRAEAIAGQQAAGHVALTAESFLKECVRRRSLGVAMVMAATAGEQEFQMVALLQSLPEFLQESRSEADALALSTLVRDVLAEPSEAERTYIGLALQAQFGAHLLSLDPDTLQARLQQMSSSAFLVDASTLIPFLARGGIGNGPARRLVEGLGSAGSAVGTTPLLVTEIDEHARWAERRVASSGEVNELTLASALGKAGTRSNAFLEGFIAETDAGALPQPSLFSYFRDVFGLQPKQTCPTESDVVRTLTREGVEVWEFNDWEGFEEIMWAERQEIADAIAERRRRNRSFKHDRQVTAEAEALLAVRYLRLGTFRHPNRAVSAAFFVSNTRLIDELVEPGSPITMRPEAALHLLATLRPVNPDELAIFTDELLGELDERGMSLVDRRRLLHVFGPLVDASQERLDGELLKHRELMAHAYGEDADQAFADVDALDSPFVVSTAQTRNTAMLEEQLEHERERSAMLAKEARLTAQDRQDLDRLRADEKIKRAFGRGRKRAAESRRRRKKK